MTRFLEGRTLAATIHAEVAEAVRELVAAGGRQPCLAAVLVGDDPGSQAYVRSKTRGCEAAGIEGRTVRFPATVSERELVATIDGLNADDTVDGILVQLPLPKHVDERRVLDRVEAAKDVDGFHPQNVGNLWLDRPGLFPATPSGVMRLLREAKVAISGRRAVVVGRSAIVGKPMAAMLLREHATVTIAHSRTPDLAALCRQADILIVAIGRPGLVSADFVDSARGAVVIDVGMNRVSNALDVERLYPGDEARRQQFESKGYILVGDVDFTRVAPKVAAITPVPGGVGLLTVAMVIANTLTASRRRQGRAPAVDSA